MKCFKCGKELADIKKEEEGRVAPICLKCFFKSIIEYAEDMDKVDLKCARCGSDFRAKEESDLCDDCRFELDFQELDKDYDNYLEDMKEQAWLEKLATMEWR